MNNKTKLFLGIAAIALMVGLNSKHALDNYGMKSEKMYLAVLAAESSSGSGIDLDIKNRFICNSQLSKIEFSDEMKCPTCNAYFMLMKCSYVCIYGMINASCKHGYTLETLCCNCSSCMRDFEDHTSNSCDH
jgi:hypothetical protein